MVKGGRFFTSREKRPVAAVYRGEVACDGCAEAVAHLLRKSPMRYKVHYLGPNEDHDINSATLSHLDVFAWPGGGDDENTDYKKVESYTKDIQDYVQNGGRYAGFCLGAFFARGPMQNQTFFGLLPQGSFTSGERFQPGAQTSSANDTIILTDWTFGSGPKKGQTVKDRWQYFQDGGQFHIDKSVQGAKIMGRYVYTNDPSAVIVPYGQGSVGLIGFHPEADQSWYDDYNIVNPQNVSVSMLSGCHENINADRNDSLPLTSLNLDMTFCVLYTNHKVQVSLL